MNKQNRYEKNKQELLNSPIVAKAAVQKRGHIEIVVVFQGSTRQEFYWVFRARSPRSPRRSWKLVNYHARDFHKYFDFTSFLVYLLVAGRDEILSQRTFQARRLAAMLSKVDHESIHADWAPQNPNRMKTDRVNEKARRGRMGRWAMVRSSW